MTDSQLLKRYLGQWHTQPWTIQRIAEMFVRATVSGLVGIVAISALVLVFGQHVIYGIGFSAPVLYTMKYGFPDHYAGGPGR